jgi:hypothetical protein
VSSRPKAKKRQHPERALVTRIERLGGVLREALLPVLEQAAGKRPRLTDLTRTLGIDKSLASLLVRAANAPNDLELMHLVPSPAGLRILADSATRRARPSALARLRTAAVSCRS